MGVVSVRGTVTTLVDLRKRLNVDAPPSQSTTASCCAIKQRGDRVFVDAVLQVYRLRETS